MRFYRYETTRNDKRCCFELFVNGGRAACLAPGYGQIGKRQPAVTLCAEHFNLMLARKGVNKNDVLLLETSSRERARVRSFNER